MVRVGLGRQSASALVDHTAANPVGAAVLLGLFQLVDLALPSHAGTTASHTMLALGWSATALWQEGRSTSGDTAQVAARRGHLRADEERR